MIHVWRAERASLNVDTARLKNRPIRGPAAKSSNVALLLVYKNKVFGTHDVLDAKVHGLDKDCHPSCRFATG